MDPITIEYLKHQKQIIHDQIAMMNRDNFKKYMELEEDEFWSEYATNMNYLHRWAVQEISLPLAIRTRIVSWVKDGDYRALLSPIVDAIETNNPKLIYDNQI